MPVTNSTTFEDDVRSRVLKLQQLMRDRGIGSAIFAATAGPGLFGVAKYFTNLVMWYGRAYVVIGVDHPEPAIVHWSSWQAAWNRQEAATSWVESPDAGVALDSIGAFGRALQIARELSGGSTSIGVEHQPETWLVGELEFARAKSPELRFIDLSSEIDALRSVKSPFEVSEIRETGRTMEEAFRAFSRSARPGERIWAATSAAEAVLKAAGCTWGRAKMSLDLRPATIPPRVDRLFRRDDVLVLELDYSSPHGYWYEMTKLFSFDPLSSQLSQRVSEYATVISALAALCRDGARIGTIAEASSRLFAEAGERVVGQHLPDLHSIGLDETDGPNSSSTPNSLLRESMTLALHPGTLFEGGQAFLMSDVFEVGRQEARRVTPDHTIYEQIGA